jgi:spoIIIJ-associated protein
VESLEVTGRTVREAIEKALTRLGRTRDEVEVSILSEGSRGILGIGGEDARILVSPKEYPPEEVPVAVEEVEEEEEDEGRLGRPSVEEITDTAAEIVETILASLRLDAEVEAHPATSDAVQSGFVSYLNIVGDDLGILIGRRGETLASLQFITNLILGKRLRRWAKVQLDVEGYRTRREQMLRTLAQRMAARVQETGVPVTLEAMPANERRIVHLTLNSHPSVSTASFGEGDQRRVVISPKR